MENANGHIPSRDLQQAYRTAYLIAGSIQQTLTEEEQEELDDWIVADENNMRLFGELTKEENVAASLAKFERMKVEQALEATKRKLKFSAPKKSTKIWTYAIAASVVITVGIYIYITQLAPKKAETIIAVSNDIKPGSDKATLTLEDGKVISLDLFNRDSLFNPNVQVYPAQGEIVYAAGNSSAELYHILSIPRKGQYKVVLPDGTKVWLNSSSSIKFPLAFSGHERRVYVTGESFFEVAKDKDKPFRVVVNEVTVEALGTQFNINAYSNEPYLSATLTEGSIKVTNGKNEDILKPGQQVQVNPDKSKVINVDTKEVTGWKNDEFVFVDTPIETIMRQVERWYDAEVIFEDQLSVHLNGTIERNVPVSRLLKILEATGHVKFEIQGNKIIVKKGS